MTDHKKIQGITPNTHWQPKKIQGATPNTHWLHGKKKKILQKKKHPNKKQITANKGY